jgi:hypothetical protein
VDRAGTRRVTTRNHGASGGFILVRQDTLTVIEPFSANN